MYLIAVARTKSPTRASAKRAKDSRVLSPSFLSLHQETVIINLIDLYLSIYVLYLTYT